MTGTTKQSKHWSNFFINFVDRIFTTSFEPLFTNVFDVSRPAAANYCVWRACNAD
jgi:hypothetical protein